jgi:hexosaminidase
MKYLILLCSLLISINILAQDINITPLPAKMEIMKGHFSINKHTVIVSPDVNDRSSADLFNEYLFKYYGFRLRMAKSALSNYISIYTRKHILPGKEGRYFMMVVPKVIKIEGDTYSGTFYALQSLIQLLPHHKPATASYQLNIPCLTIDDEPRFAYRGMHLDCSRHFWDISIVKKYIDYLAAYKFNYFHWHLTDDQGWRIEIKKYPKLTQVGGFRNGTIIGRYPGTGNDSIRYGGYYTQEQIKEIVQYASKKHITVIPEIEMPGHASAALASYPFLGCSKGPYIVQQTWGVFDEVFCAGNDSTFSFLQDVLDEVLELFPSKVIHVGGDECPKASWKLCAKCQQRIKDNNLKDEHELQSYFIQRIERYLNSKGRTLMGWDEILEGGLAPNAMVMSWRGEQGGIDAAKLKHNVVMTPGGWCYFDHSQSNNEDSVTIGGYTPLEKVYSYEPIPATLDSPYHPYILGAQGNLWTEYIQYPSKIEYMLFPRMTALSEVLWTPKEKRNWNEFEKRIPKLFERYDFENTNYSTAFYEPKFRLLPSEDHNGVMIDIDTRPQLKKIYRITLHEKLNYKKRFQDTTKVIDRLTDSSGRTLKEIVTIFDSTEHTIAYNEPIKISESLTLTITPSVSSKNYPPLSLRFNINIATGKKIILAANPSSSYPGNGGAFGLVNGLRSEKGFSSSEWLGWNGKDMEAMIDLSDQRTLSYANVHVLNQPASWIHPPQYAEVFLSNDGINYRSAGRSSELKTDTLNTGNIKISFPTTSARYVKIRAVNHGMIEEGLPGAGNNAWLFADEIEIN